jgi:hypothetical protein
LADVLFIAFLNFCSYKRIINGFMTLQQYFAKYISGETEQIEALCALYTKRTLRKKEFLLQEVATATDGIHTLVLDKIF